MKNNIFYIYGWYDNRPDKNEFFYIGKGKGNRMFAENDRNNHFKNKLSKCREMGYEPSVIKIAESLTEKKAFLLEKYYIRKYGRKDKNEGPLVNKSDGGEGVSGLIVTPEMRERLSTFAKSRINEKNSFYGKKHSTKTKQKISDSLHNNYIREDSFWKSSEYRSKMSYATMGEKNSFFGKKHSEKTVNQIRNKVKDAWRDGKYIDSVYRKKGVPLSGEHRKSISNSLMGLLIGDKNPMYDKTHTVEARRKISEASIKQWENTEYKEKMRSIHIGRTLSQEAKDRIRENNIGKNLGKRSMSKDGINKSIISEEVQSYLSNGWSFGYCYKEKRITVRNINNKRKLIYISELNDYLNNGYYVKDKK